jgi:hypothetical protein
MMALTWMMWFEGESMFSQLSMSATEFEWERKMVKPLLYAKEWENYVAR